MDGLDTLSQVALADQLNLSFDTYSAASASAASSTPGTMRAELGGDDSLNTPVTTSSDVSFNFFNPDLALPITGRFCLSYFILRYLSFIINVLHCHLGWTN